MRTLWPAAQQSGSFQGDPASLMALVIQKTETRLEPLWAGGKAKEERPRPLGRGKSLHKRLVRPQSFRPLIRIRNRLATGLTVVPVHQCDSRKSLIGSGPIGCKASRLCRLIGLPSRIIFGSVAPRSDSLKLRLTPVFSMGYGDFCSGNGQIQNHRVPGMRGLSAIEFRL